MENTRQAKANRGNRIAAGILVIIVSLFCFLSLVGALGGVGRMVYGFLAGFFGLAAYAYFLMGLIIGIAVTFNVRVKMRPSKAIMYFGLLIIGIFALHIYTSSAHIIGADWGGYLLNCYNNTNTAGGMLFGILAFPLMKLITSVGALVVACVAFFILAFFAIFPSIKRNVTYTVADKSDRQRQVANQSKPKQKRNLFKKKSKLEQTANGRLIDAQNAPILTDFSNPQKDLYVVDVNSDDRERVGDKKALGADGYKPIGFNPLYPNASGNIEDEQKRPYNPEQFSPRGIAKDILFGSGPSKDNLARFGSASDPKTRSATFLPLTAQCAETSLKTNSA